MIGDLRTMMWKEWRALAGGRARRQILLTGGTVGLFYAVLFPLQMGAEWVSDPVPIAILAVVLPVVVVGVIVPDSIAGERERHTLATLLASRLPDRAILYGKLIFGVLLGWLSLPLLLLISLMVVNVAAGQGKLLVFDGGLVLGLLTLALLLAIMTGAIGLFVSLRSRTSQEAQQLTMLGLMMPFMLVGLGLTMLLSNRELATSIIDQLSGFDVTSAVLLVLTVLAVIDCVLVVAADRRFRRSRLISS